MFRTYLRMIVDNVHTASLWDTISYSLAVAHNAFATPYWYPYIAVASKLCLNLNVLREQIPTWLSMPLQQNNV